MTQRSTGLIIAILGAICVVLALLVVIFAPDEIPVARPLALLAMAIALVVTAFGALGHFAAQGKADGLAVNGFRRWASLIAGVLSAAVMLVLMPAIGEFAAPLGEPATIIVQIVIVLFALLLAAIGIWGFLRQRAKEDKDSLQSHESPTRPR